MLKILGHSITKKQKQLDILHVLTTYLTR